MIRQFRAFIKGPGDCRLHFIEIFSRAVNSNAISIQEFFQQMNISRCHYLATVISLAMTCVISGCGFTSGKPSVDGSSTEATVSGKVILKGRPATSGTVIFDPSNYIRKNEPARRTEIQKDGSFSIKTLTGSNSIRVEGREANAVQGADYAGLAYDVPAGQSTFDIKLPPEVTENPPENKPAP